MTIKEAQYQLKKDLSSIYELSEAQNITHWVMESLTGMKKIDRLMNENIELSNATLELFHQYIQELLSHKPIQYVLGEAYFYGHRFFVKEGVLIPRPETEELVDWIIKEVTSSNIKILDVGTGSGCIPISLKLSLKESLVQSVDISAEAIAIAQKNAQDLGASIEFKHRDFLQWEQYEWEPVDVLVSNPPYIPQNEKTSMMVQVTEHEPSIALFVADEEPLIFYTKLASFGKKYLSENGIIYVEIHEDLGAETVNVFELGGYKNVELKKDFQGRDRMIKAKL